MPYDIFKAARGIISEADAVLIIAGAGMSVDSGIPTYRCSGGLWEKSIKLGDTTYRYDEISSLDMWENFPELAWGFKARFMKTVTDHEPHEGYNTLLRFCRRLNNNYFVCTSNIDNYFERAGFDADKIYEVHGTVKYIQCMDKKCATKHGVLDTTPALIPPYNEETMLAHNLPVCPKCTNMLRPNISMFGDFKFCTKMCEYSSIKLENWLDTVNKNNQKLVILEIGCGINPHSLRMNNGTMLSNEWKLPRINNLLHTIRLNPEEEEETYEGLLHLPLGAKRGLKQLLCSSS